MSNKEDSMPAVCENCLGSNPYLEMIRERNGLECKTCTRPFTVFKWAAEKGGSFKKTVICLTCARSKNCCQSCMLDLTYGIDLTTRDQLIKLAGGKKTLTAESASHQTPKNEVAKRYNANQLDRKYNEIGEAGLQQEALQRRVEAREMLTKISKIADAEVEIVKRTANKRKRTDEGKDVKITKDDLLKLCKNLPFNGNLKTVPQNPNIKTFFLFGLTNNTPTYLVKQFFTDLINERSNSKKIESVFINEKGRFGYIEFSSQSIAKDIASKIIGLQKVPDYDRPCLILIDGKVPIRVVWSRKVITSGSDYSNVELHKISEIVKKQMIKQAEKDNGGKRTPDGEKDYDHHHQQPEIKDKKKKQKVVTAAVPRAPPGKALNYKSLKSDLEL